MNRFEFQSHSEDDTRALGKALAAALPDGVVVGLNGTLGAGKTRLVQAIAACCGIDATVVVSPTFVLIHEHHGDRSLYHFDAYRLEDDDQFLELGPDEYFAAGGICLIEWASRVEGCLPRERVEINISVTGDASRAFEVVAVGDRYLSVIEQLMVWQTTC